MNEQLFDTSNNELRLFQMRAPWLIVIKEGSGKIDDLLNCRPGGIVRVNGKPSDCIQIMRPEVDEELGCVAGWISDEP